MTKRDKQRHTEYRSLKAANVDVSKPNQIRFNSGSETARHLVAKALVGYVGSINGYWVSSECECVNGDIDVLLYGHPDRLTYAVECETGWTEAKLSDKVDRYVHENPPIDDLIAIEVLEMPTNIVAAAGWIADELGLNL